MIYKELAMPFVSTAILKGRHFIRQSQCISQTKHKNLLLLYILGLASLQLGCTTDLSEYKQTQVSSVNQQFDIQTYFTGDLIAHGLVQNYADKVTRRFCVELRGTWEENTGTLAEKFYFDDGEISYRNWQLVKVTDGVYQGKAEDVVGVAEGKHQGFAFQFTYDLLLTLDEETYEVSMDDWMYQIDKYRVVNRTSMSKFSVTVANITIFFDKETHNTQCQNQSI